jgi:toxin FitB
MKALLDTCILSGLRHPTHANLLKNAMQFIDTNDLFLSVISIGEIAKGIALLPASKKKSELQNWALRLENVYADRILNITREVVHIWGELTAQAKLKGIIIPVSDGLIAATALANGLHVMTSNVADFQATGVLLLNPWEGHVVLTT